MDRRTADFMRKMEYVNQDQQNALLALIDAIKAKVRYAKLKLKKCQKIYVYKNLLTKVKYFLAGFLNYLTNLFLGMTKRLALCSSLYELADFMFY